MGSIRGRGPHNVIIQNRDVGRTPEGYKHYVPVGDPVLLENCYVEDVREWATAEENYEHGLQLLSLRRIFARDWPGDANSLVYARGGEFETVGTPQFMDMSRRTTHWVITIKWLGDKPPPTVPEVTNG